MLITFFGWIVSLPIVAATIVFATEVLCGTFAPREPEPSEQFSGRAVVLMPAHNEAAGIASTLLALNEHLDENVDVLVIADNCDDDTAKIAAGHGARVAARIDAHLRGKSYALAYGADCLRHDPPEFVVVLDADCVPQKGAIRRLVSAAERHSAPSQAEYLFEPSTGTEGLVEVSNFAFYIKNSVRQLGLRRLGAPAVLTGTGMAFPWEQFATANLASGSLVEDLELGINLTLHGHAPVYVPSARILSAPASVSAMDTQRSRWEGGFIGTARTHALPLILRGTRLWDLRLIWLGLHLATPPLAMLVLLNVLVLAIAAATAVLAGAVSLLYVVASAQAIAGIGLGAAWLRGGKAYLPAKSLLGIPLYVLWKIPLYLKLLRRSESTWVRTDRE